MSKSSALSAADLNGVQRQVSRFIPLRQLLIAFLFDLGLCASGRHRHADRVNRSRCCNGFRIAHRAHCENGDIFSLLELRPITLADPRFAWEAEPPMLLEMHTSVNAHFLKKPGHMPGHDRAFGPPQLTLIEAHFAAGGVK
jgi:hypothetical protein